MIPLNLYNTEKPYLSRLPSGTKLPRTNIVTESHALQVFNVSGHESGFTLEKSGFQYAKSPIRMEQWNDFSVSTEYIPKLEEWLVKHLKCSSAFIYAYNVSSFFEFSCNMASLNIAGVSRERPCQCEEQINQDSVFTCTLR
jgi:hypothetical protein